jgi:hypothetical protein
LKVFSKNNGCSAFGPKLLIFSFKAPSRKTNSVGVPVTSGCLGVRAQSSIRLTTDGYFPAIRLNKGAEPAQAAQCCETNNMNTGCEVLSTR